MSLYEIVTPTPAISNWVKAAASEASPLLELAQIQTVTRKEAKRAALAKNPLVNKTTKDLLTKIQKL